MVLQRRTFVRHLLTAGGGALLAPSLAGLPGWSSLSAASVRRYRAPNNGGYGPLVQSADCPELWIPEGFRAVRVSRSLAPSPVRPELLVPNGHDGMAAFALPNGNVRLIRNHELADAPGRGVALGSRPYDPKAAGGTTSLEVAIRGTGSTTEVVLVDEFVSLGGTATNCAGGPTPWASWLSCEETTRGTALGYDRPHGYVFDVPVAATDAVEPVPLPALGRFTHEAVAVDPRTDILYQTEDLRWNPEVPNMPGSGFYRFLPAMRQRLEEGGRLQMLAVAGRPAYNTVLGQTVGERLPVTWVEIEDPDPANAEEDPSAVFREGLARGGAIFHRLEGCFWADDSCYFVATSGGDAGAGQVWRFIPEGDGGWLTLIFESPGRAVLDSPDNICVSPRGSVVICEDGDAEQYIRGLTREGLMVDLVMQPVEPGEPEPSEFAGATYDPSGQVLFFNVQGSTSSTGPRPGTTYALCGPWLNGAI